MIEEMVIRHGAPTLAGLKTANLFQVKNKEENIAPLLRDVNRVLTKKGMRLIPVRKNGSHILLYLYRPERLRADLDQPEAKGLLREKGYPHGNPDKCLNCLIQHLKEDEAFPHEIGLFLGYPPSDVKCFMKNTREGVKCTGCWKAYSNKEEAERVFEAYRKCTCTYYRQMKKGRTLEDLAVKERSQGTFRAVS